MGLLPSASNVVVLGKEVRDELLGSAAPLGETVRMENFPFKVIGVLSEKGSSGWRSEDNRVLVPYTVDHTPIKWKVESNGVDGIITNKPPLYAAHKP